MKMAIYYSGTTQETLIIACTDKIPKKKLILKKSQFF